MNYEIDFSNLTIGDLVDVVSNDTCTADWIILADKVVVGGVCHLPYTELMDVLQAVAPATRMMLEQLAGCNGSLGIWKVADA